ncbi:MAG: type V toxin-antitoxin system endoribonuclease antitoxin GhoS [Serratia liquefaciens]|nr:type V toxin-antitoxin system endoribonuclease antitoxin GhoS [Serratia liquefaciens]
MSQSATTCFVVTFRYQEEGLADLAKLVSDENGVPHELGSNSFALITPQDQADVRLLAEKLGQVALGKAPEVDIVTYEDYLKRLHADT